LIETLEELDRDPDVRVIVIGGSGGNFAVGADVSEMVSLSSTDVVLGDFTGSAVQLAEIQKPVIAAVEGYALGGGCELAEMSDIVVATQSAKFGHPEARLGTMPGAGGTQRVTQVAGKHKAMDMLLTGRLVSAHEAYLSGLVSRVVSDTSLWQETEAIALQIASLSPPIVRMIKQAVSHGVNSFLGPGLALERRLFHLTFSLADRTEGMSAFVQKRKPCFKGR